MTDRLPSWRPGATRDTLLDFLDTATSIPEEERVACIDNDGTMWCERPTYVQLDFLVDALRQRVETDGSLAERPEFEAVLSGDAARMEHIGLAKIAVALAALFDGETPEQFGAAVDEFLGRYRHHPLDLPIEGIVFQPMRELLDELRRLDFTIGIVTGGGTEFVRRVARRLYGVEPGMVVGTLVGYEFGRDEGGKPIVRRSASQMGTANEGGAKVAHIHSQIGVSPILVVGNSGGDREMLEWAQAHPLGGLAMLVNHDDTDREFSYLSTAETFAESEAITDVGKRLGWTIISVRDDWDPVFPPA